MSMTEREQAKAAQIAAATDKFIVAKNGIKEKLNEYGVPVSDAVPFADYPGKVDALGQRSIPTPTTTIVTVQFNPVGSIYWLPESEEEREALLNDAVLILSIRMGAGDKSYSLPIKALEGNAYSFRVEGIEGTHAARIVARFGATTAVCAPVSLTVSAGLESSEIITTVRKRGVFKAFGRAQLFTGDANDALTSYPIVLSIIDGVSTYAFGHFDSAGKFVSTCGVKVQLGYWDEVMETAGVRTVDGDTSENAVPLENFLNAFGGIRITTLKVGTGTPNDDVHVELPAAFTKREIIPLAVDRLNSSGAVASTSTDNYLVTWLADEAYDPTWHRHTAFQREVFNETTHEYEAPVDLEKILIQRYASNAGGYSLPDGTIEVAANQATWWSRYSAKNALPVSYTDAIGTTHAFAAGEDARRFHGTGYKQISYIQLCAYLWFGVNVQGVLQGICTSTNRTSTYNGDSDVLVQNCGLFAGFCTTSGSTKNYNPNNRTIVFMGLEDALWSSTGWIAGDVICGYVTDENLDSFTELYYCRDPKKVTPGTGNKTTLLANGYEVIAANFLGGTNRRQIASEELSVRDLYFPTNSAGNENITVGATDAIWQTTPQAATGIKYQMVALGNYRGYGGSLGAFTLNAIYGLGASGGYWRSRSTCELVESGE